jgi:hypothetical protein
VAITSLKAVRRAVSTSALLAVHSRAIVLEIIDAEMRVLEGFAPVSVESALARNPEQIVDVHGRRIVGLRHVRGNVYESEERSFSGGEVVYIR